MDAECQFALFRLQQLRWRSVMGRWHHGRLPVEENLRSMTLKPLSLWQKDTKFPGVPPGKWLEFAMPRSPVT
jgi:hypothetical protein